MLLGVVFAASGLHHALRDPTSRLDTTSAAQVSGFVELVALLVKSVVILLIERARHTSPVASRPAR